MHLVFNFVNFALVSLCVAVRILDPGSMPFRPLDLGSGMGKKIRIRIRDEQPGSYFRELRNNFWVKTLKFFEADPDQGSRIRNLFDPGSGIQDGKKSDPG